MFPVQNQQPMKVQQQQQQMNPIDQRPTDQDDFTMSISSQEDGPFSQHIEPWLQKAVQSANGPTNLNNLQSDLNRNDQNYLGNGETRNMMTNKTSNLPKLQLENLQDQSVQYDQNKYNNKQRNSRDQISKNFGCGQVNTQQSTAMGTQISSGRYTGGTHSTTDNQVNTKMFTNRSEVDDYEQMTNKDLVMDLQLQQLTNLQKQVQNIEDEFTQNKNAVNKIVQQTDIFTGNQDYYATGLALQQNENQQIQNQRKQTISPTKSANYQRDQQVSFDDDESSVPQEQTPSQSMEICEAEPSSDGSIPNICSSKESSVDEKLIAQEEQTLSEGDIPPEDSSNQMEESHHHPNDDLCSYTCNKDQYNKLKSLVHTAKDAIDSLKIEIDLLKDSNSSDDTQMRQLLNRLYKDHMGKKSDRLTVNFLKENQVVKYHENEPVSARSNRPSISPMNRNKSPSNTKTNFGILNKASFRDDLLELILKQSQKTAQTTVTSPARQPTIFFSVKDLSTQQTQTQDSENTNPQLNQNKLKIASLQQELQVLKQNYMRYKSPQPSEALQTPPIKKMTLKRGISPSGKPTKTTTSKLTKANTTLSSLLKDRRMFIQDPKTSSMSNGDSKQSVQNTAVTTTTTTTTTKNYSSLKQRYIQMNK